MFSYKGKCPCSSVSWNHFLLQLFWRNLNFSLCPFSRPLRKRKKSCFASELNWTQKVCLQQPAMFCFSSSNVDNKNSVEWITCLWHQKNESTNSPMHKFKVLQNIFEKPLNWKSKAYIVLKEIIYHLKGVLKGSLPFLQHFKFLNW